MARWATKVIIAGVDLTGCRAKLVDPAGFQSAYAGSVDWANDGTAHVQVINRGVKGIPFGIKFTSTETADLQAILAAIQTAQSTGSTFEVEIIDGMYDLSLNVDPDYSQQWLTHDEHSEGWYDNVVFRFISKSAMA